MKVLNYLTHSNSIHHEPKLTKFWAIYTKLPLKAWDLREGRIRLIVADLLGSLLLFHTSRL